MPGELSKMMEEVFGEKEGKGGEEYKRNENESKEIEKEKKEMNEKDFVLSQKWYGRTVVLLNGFLFLVAVLLIAVGVSANENPVVHLLTGQTLPVGAVSLGCLFLVVVGIGCIGMAIKSRLLLLTYAVLFVCLLICQIVIGGMLYSTRNDASTSILNSWPNASNDLKVSLQNQYNCCGLLSFNFSAGNPCPINATQTCFSSLIDAYNSAYSTVGTFLIVFFFVECFAILTAVYFIKKIRNLRQSKQVDNGELMPTFELNFPP